MELQKFLRKNGIEGLSMLSKPPYSLSIKTDARYPSLVLLKYTVESDASLSINNEARGVIFDTTNWNVVARGFDRFFNYCEPNAATIDFSTAKVQEKIDGSIMKAYNYKGKWIISSSSMINANQIIDGKNFGELFFYAAFKQNLDFNKLNPNNTYIFELVSPYTQVIVYYPKTEIYHIGTRNNLTGLEVEEDIGIQKPHLFNFNSIDEIEVNLNSLTKNEEGYVVVDAAYNRVKMKSIEWLKAHALLGNGQLTIKKVVQLLLNKEDFNEYVAYFPSNRAVVDSIKNKIVDINDYVQGLSDNVMSAAKTMNKKEAALYIQSTYNKKDIPIAFMALKDPNLINTLWSSNDVNKIYNFYKRFNLSL